MGPRGRLEPEFVAPKDLATAVDLLELAARRPREGLEAGLRLRSRIDRYLRLYGGRLKASRPDV